MFRALFVVAIAIAGAVPSQATAQTDAELILYSRGQFKGARQSATGPKQGIDPPFTVRSVVVPPGTQWELCSGNTFSGCRQLSNSEPSMVMTVRSVRPIAPVLTSSISMPPGATAAGRSLRGLASEYFVTPDLAGNRVLVQSDTGEAASTKAREFCRSRGWRSSAYHRLQTVGQHSYLADVLCVDAGN